MKKNGEFLLSTGWTISTRSSKQPLISVKKIRRFCKKPLSKWLYRNKAIVLHQKGRPLGLWERSLKAFQEIHCVL